MLINHYIIAQRVTVRTILVIFYAFSKLNIKSYKMICVEPRFVLVDLKIKNFQWNAAKFLLCYGKAFLVSLSHIVQTVVTRSSN